MHYLCVVIILFITYLHKSAFSTCSFKKKPVSCLFFCDLSLLSVLFWTQSHLHRIFKTFLYPCQRKYTSREVFSFLKTLHLQRKSGTSKIKYSTETLANMIYKSFILEHFILVLAFYSHCGDKAKNTDFCQITCFKERRNMSVEETGYR